MESFDNKEKELSKALKETISLSNLGDIGVEIAEVTIDSILKEGVLKDFPIIGALVGIWKTGVTIKDYLFLKKLLLFLNESSSLSEEIRKTLIENLEDESYQSEAGEKLISIIDKLETASKSKMLGKSIALFGNGNISKDEFWRVSYIIEKLPMSDIMALRNWIDLDLNKIESVRKHLYLSVGIGWFVLNSSSTGFVWQKRLCEIFAKELI